MAKKKQYVCQSCGCVSPRWAGKCSACGEWNTIVEEAAEEIIPKGLKPGKGNPLKLCALSDDLTHIDRYETNIKELED